MLEDDGVHPDEGTIHAWLDDALDADASALVAEHVAGCASCEARVAEARGLIAGAARVVGLLDDKPTPLIKPAATPTAGTDLSVRRLLRVTPARAHLTRPHRGMAASGHRGSCTEGSLWVTRSRISKRFSRDWCPTPFTKP